jgi:hypothetical protein
MKLKLSEIVIGIHALQRIGNEKLPIQIAYNLQRNMRLMQPEAQQYDDKRVELIKTKYGVEKDGNWTVPPDNLTEFQAEMNDLGSVEVDIDVHTINLDEVSDVMISLNDLYPLDWMFEAGATPPKKAGKKA